MRKARSSGFTIIEVLIVLAVTALLFLSATALISGRSSQTEFDQSSRNFEQQIENVITQVDSGTYNATSAGCTQGSTSLTFGGGNTGQGTDGNCTYIGAVVQLGEGSDQSYMDTYVLGGNRLQNGGSSDVTGLTNAAPTIVQLGSGQPDKTETQLEYGLHTYTNGGSSSMNYSLDGGHTYTPIGAFALVYSFATYSGGTIESGSQQINLVPIKGSALGENYTSLVDAMTSLRNGTSPDNASGTEVTICTRGITGQYALVTIGGSNNGSSNNGQLGVTLTILGSSNGTTCP